MSGRTSVEFNTHRELATHDHPLHPTSPSELHPLNRRHSHLRASVYGEAWSGPTDQLDRAQVLHDHRVHPRPARGLGDAGKRHQLVVKYQHVQHQIALHPPLVEERHDIRQRVHVKVLRARSGVEVRDTKVDGVRPVLRGRTQLLPSARGGEHLGLRQGPGRWWCCCCSCIAGVVFVEQRVLP